ncbi:MAG: pyridoxal-phosphate dependent enzyme [Ginsengibacter sp.]
MQEIQVTNAKALMENFKIPVASLKSKVFSKNNIGVSMLRLDTIHPIVSGNKIFKLHYFLEEAKKSTHRKIITFGGAYSNHLAATAYACEHSGLTCIGIVRGEEPKKLSHTLQFCLKNNMHLQFIARSFYKKINEEEFLHVLTNECGPHTLVPEGGCSLKGVDGAKLISNYFNSKKFSHVCCPIGTATTFAGLINGTHKETKIIGFNILKNMLDTEERLAGLGVSHANKYTVINDYHFGGYAKRTPELIAFMNTFYQHYAIPLDFVYTGKMMCGLYDLINKNYFPGGSNILCIHTGGLQGNDSLPERLLSF